MIQLSENIKLFTTDESRIEGSALQQLRKTAELPGVIQVAAMPDLHPGKGGPVGAAFMIKDRIYPYIVGSDVGCGMSLWNTGMKKAKLKRDKWVRKLSGLEQPWDGDREKWLAGFGLKPSDFDDALGTIGGGNHFAELQLVETVHDPEAFESLGLDKGRLVLLVHSGSRGMGASLLREHTDEFGAGGLDIGSDRANAWLKAHDTALEWAKANRALIARRFLDMLGEDGTPTVDVFHNSISRLDTPEGPAWLHRKGVAASDQAAIVIPGTRGTLSYLVMPSEDQTPNLWSVAHGAGRKWNRSSTKERLKERYTAKSFLHTDLGGVVICEDRDLLYEEAPQAYKNIDKVIADMVDDGLIRVIATFRPLITYKVRQSE